jgi:hypothetical protein
MDVHKLALSPKRKPRRIAHAIISPPSFVIKRLNAGNDGLRGVKRTCTMAIAKNRSLGYSCVLTFPKNHLDRPFFLPEPSKNHVSHFYLTAGQKSRTAGDAMNPVARSILLASFFSLPTRLAYAAPKNDAVEIVRAEFGLFDARDPKETVFTETSVVPRRKDQRYGWIIEVRTRKRSLSVREEYLLPPSEKPASEARDASGRVVLFFPMKRRVQVSQRQLVPVGNRIVGEWVVGPDELAGRRHLQVIVENAPAVDFEFDMFQSTP